MLRSFKSLNFFLAHLVYVAVGSGILKYETETVPESIFLQIHSNSLR